MIKFRIAWWFKHHGKDTSDPVTLLLLNIKDCCKDSKRAAAPKLESWIPPDLDHLKFNVDGAARGSPGPAGIGGVLRNLKGKVLCSFSSFQGHQYADYVEIVAILRACQLCASGPVSKQNISPLFHIQALWWRG
ncbi:hypothetical protein LWI29_026415 [Acer saccharum]|uniref:RNase H type-1 domain-containing protein n=1 Tax=Acer saccharum TaxID=4024 RepID=A0AA39SHX0_ACESA|nr:hypothetical protein LWI29_026415 [Acer saccharum]